jgi:hypothetical protein
MESRTLRVAIGRIFPAHLTAVMFCAVGVLASSAQQPMAPEQSTFATPQQAAQALIVAAEAYDVPALIKVLGPAGKDLVASGDPVLDKERALAFAALAREKQAITVDPKNSGRAVLSVGNTDWPVPIPIVKRNGKWYYDTNAGRREILFRRIGANELDAIEICRGFVEAQKEYAQENHDDSQLHQYAQRIISSSGKHDGLAWQNPDGSWGGPVGEAVAKALEEGYGVDHPPYHGYYFKVLKGQGPAAPLGQIDFVIHGAMLGGFALAAAPAGYRITGVKTFIVSHDGIVYEKDLGPDTLTVFKAMQRYNPDKTWRPTNDAP